MTTRIRELPDGTHGPGKASWPVPGMAGDRPVRRFATEEAVQLSLADNGTSLIAGQARSSNDEKLLHRIGAGQRLFGGIGLTGSIGATAQVTSKKGVGIVCNQSW
jgi:hypothetical protein